jgi:hypothetical protein
MQNDATGFAELRKCAKGDTIIIPAGSGSVVARVCDFTRSMILAGGNVICMMQDGERPRKQ